MDKLSPGYELAVIKLGTCCTGAFPEWYCTGFWWVTVGGFAGDGATGLGVGVGSLAAAVGAVEGFVDVVAAPLTCLFFVFEPFGLPRLRLTGSSEFDV